MRTAQKEGLLEVWLVPGFERMTGHVIALRYGPEMNDGKPWRLLFGEHEASQRCFYDLPPGAVQLWP